MQCLWVCYTCISDSIVCIRIDSLSRIQTLSLVDKIYGQCYSSERCSKWASCLLVKPDSNPHISDAEDLEKKWRADIYLWWQNWNWEENETHLRKWKIWWFKICVTSCSMGTWRRCILVFVSSTNRGYFILFRRSACKKEWNV